MEHSAASDAGHVVGAIVGYVVIYGGILALGWFFGKRLGRARDIGFVRWPLHVAVVLALVLLAGQCARKGEAHAAAIALA